MNHTAYITACVEAIRAEGLVLCEVVIDDTAQRHASLGLELPAETEFEDLQAATARWDEHDGWSVTMVHPGGSTTVAHGQLLVPAPAVAAAWIALVLTAPAWIAPRPPALLADDSGGLDEELARYTPAGPVSAGREEDQA
ncbi:DUF6292 family protein [Saccharopolyspora sp. 7B]|uniref:DUF6292 family protein n=1 Tax=Saccharopolyspora sp. 7B TaxID=2877240 RepID=UPI001CD429EB|nr:DUF6292 family protein [Saccharopolyspora sp. 7B]MCA1278268.1 DUF6292 family protein [Saccharopolyspora sp. 7B]